MADIEQRPVFWVVWEPTIGRTNFRHATFQAAEREAERLARECPGREFIVLQSRISVTTLEMHRVHFVKSGDEIPF